MNKIFLLIATCAIAGKILAQTGIIGIVSYPDDSLYHEISYTDTGTKSLKLMVDYRDKSDRIEFRKNGFYMLYHEDKFNYGIFHFNESADDRGIYRVYNNEGVLEKEYFLKRATTRRCQLPAWSNTLLDSMMYVGCGWSYDERGSEETCYSPETGCPSRYTRRNKQHVVERIDEFLPGGNMQRSTIYRDGLISYETIYTEKFILTRRFDANGDVVYDKKVPRKH